MRWRGRELFYIDAAQQLTSVSVTLAAGRPPSLAPPVRLFRIDFDGSFGVRQQYAVSPDGQRFLVNAPTAVTSASVAVVLNWKPAP